MGWGQAGEAWRARTGASFGKLPADAKLSDVFGGGAGGLGSKLQRRQAALVQSSNGTRRPSPNAPKVQGGLGSKLDLTRNLHGKPRDALGRRAAAGVPDSQSASERGESAKREKPPRTRLASSGGQLTQRSERDAGRAAGSGGS